MGSRGLQPEETELERSPMTYDNLFKDFIEDLIEKSMGFKFRTEMLEGKLPLKIDVIIHVFERDNSTSEIITHILMTTRFAEYNLVEFKSNHYRPWF